MAEKQWTVAIGNGFHFDIVPVGNSIDPWSDAALNGRYPTRLAALEKLIDGQEQSRAALAGQIARAKRMRARLLKRRSPNG